MNWPYIAGFFDGEGCITMMMENRRTPVVSMAQSRDRGRNLLEEIQQFLRSNGIDSIVSRKVGRETSLGKLPMYAMRINKGTLKFLENTMPYLRIKRPEAQDVLRFHKMYPPMPKGWWVKNGTSFGNAGSRGFKNRTQV